MGLDMYLYAEKSNYSGYAHAREAAGEDSPEVREFDMIKESFGIDLSGMKHVGSADIRLQVGYWRKANAVHDWFVRNVQDGEDDCRTAEVTWAQLNELYQLSKDIREGCTLGGQVIETSIFGDYEWYEEVEFTEHAKTRIQGELMPAPGFFFGSTELDYGYVQDLDKTIEILGTILSQTEGDPYKYTFYYSSSW